MFPKEKLDQINEELLRRVACAKTAYIEAKSACEEAQANKQDAMHPDGEVRCRNAIRAERAAVRAYTDAVKALTAFTLNQRLPSAMPQFHAPQAGHFTCRCGEPLVFGTEQSAYTLLYNQRQESGRKLGECPRCGCIHEITTSRL